MVVKIEVQDIGNTVLCDGCSKDFTESDELDHVKGQCPVGISFRDFVLWIRGGEQHRDHA